jgi:hypothetical protein
MKDIANFTKLAARGGPFLVADVAGVFIQSLSGGALPTPSRGTMKSSRVDARMRDVRPRYPNTEGSVASL